MGTDKARETTVLDKNVQVLSQLLWDLHKNESTKEQQERIIQRFYQGLGNEGLGNLAEKEGVHRDSYEDEMPSDSSYAMYKALAKPLRIVCENNNSMARDYLKCCDASLAWPYLAFLAELITVMEKNSVWSSKWQSLSTANKKKKQRIIDDQKKAVRK